MLSSRNIMFHFVFVCCIGAAHVPGQGFRDITPTDTILKVLNEIFSCLKLKLNGNSNNKELLIHLLGFFQYKSDNWKEILRLTSSDTKTGNSSTDYMNTVIKEVINRKNKTGGRIDICNVNDVNTQSKNFLLKLKEIYLRKIPYRTQNNKTSQLLSKGRTRHSTYSKNTVAGEINLAEKGTEDIEVWVPSHSRRIFAAQETRISYYPFLASIHIFTQFTCAGSIIADDLVITAASCLQLAYNNRFYRENAQFLAVRVGSSYYGVAGDLIPVLEVYFHPSYDPPTLHNNLAIVRLRRHIRFRNRARVKKVDIDQNANALPWNTNGIVIVGWGAKTITNKIKDPLKNKIAISILDFYPLEECQEIYSKTFVTEKHFCAGFITRGGGACNRDVGAPGLAGGVLVGVVSFASSSCGAADAPTVFTKLGYYTNWIEEIMAQETHLYRPTATYRPPPIHTIMTTAPKSFNFILEPFEDHNMHYRPPVYEKLINNRGQMKNKNVEISELRKNKNTQEQADVPSATNPNFILRDKTSKFTVLHKLLPIDKIKTKSQVVNQPRKPVHPIGRAGWPRDEEYTEATTETKFDSITEKSPEPIQFYAYEVMAMQLPQIVLPKKQSSASKSKETTPFEQVADSPKTNEKDLVLEPPEVTFSDPVLNQQINDLIDYINIIDKNSLEQEYFSNDLNTIGVSKLPEDLKILEIIDDKLAPMENDVLNLENLNEIDDDKLAPTENNVLNLEHLNEIDDDKLAPTEKNVLNLEHLNEIDDDKLEPTEDDMLNLNLNEIDLT